MISWWVNTFKNVCVSIPSTPCSFCRLFSKPHRPKVLFKESSFCVYYLLLVISLFFKVYIFPKVLQICYLPVVSYGSSTSFRLQKETMNKWTNSNLDGAVCLRIFGVKSKLSYISSNHYSCAWLNCWQWLFQ